MAELIRMLTQMIQGSLQLASLTSDQRDRLAGVAIAAYQLADDAVENGKTESLVKILCEHIEEALSRP